jgi:hypothetical protein
VNYIATHLMVYLTTFFVATALAVLWALEPTTANLVIAGKLWAIAFIFGGLVPVCHYCERRAAGE